MRRTFAPFLKTAHPFFPAKPLIGLNRLTCFQESLFDDLFYGEPTRLSLSNVKFFNVRRQIERNRHDGFRSHYPKVGRREATNVIVSVLLRFRLTALAERDRLTELAQKQDRRRQRPANGA